MFNPKSKYAAVYGHIKVAFCLLVCFLMATGSLAAIPAISNVQVQQPANNAPVEISYDLFDADDDLMYVSVVASLDGGLTWTVPCRTVSGDVGGMISSGAGHLIQWDAQVDLFDFVGENCKVRIFAVDVSPYPEMEYFRVVGSDTLAMSGDIPDTLAYGESLHLMWGANASVIEGLPAHVVNEMDTVWPYDDGLLGYKWRFMDDNCNSEMEDCWHPRIFDEASGDSISYFSDNFEFLFKNDGSGFDPWSRILDSGQYHMRYNSIDIAGIEVLEPSGQEFSFVVNYDPETILLKGETDWAHPEDPEIYPYYTLLNDPDQIHYPFIEGDRIPDRSYVVFKALYRDDPRDQALNPAYSMGITGNATGLINIFTGGNFQFQTGASSVDVDPAWDAGLNGFYADTLGFMPSPRTEFTFRMVGVDEHGRRDGTPPEMSFMVGYPPCVQCLELRPESDQPSQYSDDLACYEPDSGNHPCFGDTSVFYIKAEGVVEDPGQTYLHQTGLGYIGIHKATGVVKHADSPFEESVYYNFPSELYRMEFLMHGRDDASEAWADPLSRMMGWRYQVDYDCDPSNSIADGGGNDDLYSPTWGESVPANDGLEISASDGVWTVGVDIVVPVQLTQFGPEIFRLVIQNTMAEGDPELADELFYKCIRQLSTGKVQAVALDQTACGFTPERPAMYHVFSDVRPPAGGPGSGTWRDCNPDFGSVDFSIDLRKCTMASLNDVPVENNFRIVFEGTDGNYGCEPDLYQGSLAQPAWNDSE